MAPVRDGLRKSLLSGAALLAAGSTVSLVYVQREFGAGLLPILESLGLLLVIGAVLVAAWKLPPPVGIAGAALLSLCVRIAVALWLAGKQPGNDPLAYETLARSVLSGDGLVAWGARALYPPLYPLLLAGAFALVPNIIAAITILNTLIDAAGAALLYLLARKLLDERAAALATATMLLWPPYLVSSAQAQKEGLTVALTLAILFGFVRWMEMPETRRAALVGLAWGLLALTQPAVALLPFFLLAVVPAVGLRPAAATMRGAGVAVMVAGLVLVPWWVRNFAVLGTFVPLTSVGGDTFSRLVPADSLTLHGSDRALPEGASGAQLGRQATRWIVAHPTGYLANVMVRGARGLLLEISPVQQLLTFRPPPGPRAIATAMIWCQISYASLWVAVSLSLARWKRTSANRMILAFALAVAAHLLAVSIWIQFYDRHRQYLTPIALLVACAALSRGEQKSNASW